MGPLGRDSIRVLRGTKLPVGMDCLDAEAAVEIVMIYFLESLEYFRESSVRQVISCRETNLTSQRQKERNLVHNENVDCQEKRPCAASPTRFGL
jgi:hypothetical protein